jgi:hypothetical protein
MDMPRSGLPTIYDKVGEGDGNTDGREEVLPILYVKVQMRFGAIPCVAAPPYRLTAPDTLSHLHEDTSPHEMSIQSIFV